MSTQQTDATDTIKILLKRELYSYSVADGPTASRDFCGWETVFFRHRRVLSLPNVAVKPLAFINEWVGSLSGKSSSVENKIIVIRQFLEFLKHTGESVAMPSIPSLR